MMTIDNGFSIKIQHTSIIIKVTRSTYDHDRQLIFLIKNTAVNAPIAAPYKLAELTKPAC